MKGTAKGGWLKRRGGEEGGWENDSEMLRSPPLRASRERTARTIHCSRAEWRAAKEGEGEGERQAKQAFTAAAGSNGMAGAKIWDWSLDPGALPLC